MLPVPLHPLQAIRSCLLRPFAASAAGLLIALCVPSPLHAQETTPPEAERKLIAFEADAVDYDSEGDVLTASGNVVLHHQGQTLQADSVRWNRTTGQITADGHIRLTDADGAQLFTDTLELTDELKAGAMANMLLVLTEGGRMAARSGELREDGKVELRDAVYSGCAVVDRDGCERKPSWRIIANRVTYDQDNDRAVFHGARLEVFGVPLVALPGLTVNTDGQPRSGLLIPAITYSRNNGLELSSTYYARLSRNRELEVTGYAFSEVPPMLRSRYSALTQDGAYQITGYLTHSRRVTIGGDTEDRRKDWRGYLSANGRFQLDPNWSVTASGRLASDRTFLRRYDISRDDRLRSMIDVERIDDTSYLSISGWATQTLRVDDSQGQVPIALPIIDYRRRLASPVLGGRVELQGNSMAITRTSGQETQRAFASARWDLRRLTGMGQEVTLTALLRGDVYHSDQNDLTQTAIYRGNPGWETRGVALGAIDVKWPFIGKALGGTQVFTPRLQLVATPRLRNLSVPNEDARAIDLEDSNLFALNRFPGYDRVEEGVRLTYGFDWQLDRPGWRIKSTIGQSYRLTREPDILPDGTGLADRFSDYVGRTEIRFRDFVSFTHRFRLDKDDFTIRRNEVNAAVGSRKTYAEVSYLKLNRDIAELEDLRDREELRVAGRIAIADYWSIFGSSVINLTDRKEDATAVSDGWEPLRTRVGIAYQDDCLEFGVTWRHDYQSTGDARAGDRVMIYFSLRNLGVP